MASLAGITHCMEDLALAGCPRLRDIAAITGHASMHRLYLSKCSKLTDVEAVFTLPALRG